MRSQKKNRRKKTDTGELLQIKQSHYFLFFLLFVSIFACYKLFQPYLNPIILAVILAAILHPIHRKIEEWTHHRKNFAALISCTLLTLVVVLPLLFMMISLVQQGIQAFNAITTWSETGKYKEIFDFSTDYELTEQSFESLQAEEIPQELITNLESLKDTKITGEEEFLAALAEQIGEEQVKEYQGTILKHAGSSWIVRVFDTINRYLPNLDLQALFPNVNLQNIQFDSILLQTSQRLGRALINQGGLLFGNMTALIAKFFLMIFIFFFMIRDQEAIFDAVLHLVPLSASAENEIISKIKDVAQSALLGAFVTAAAQGAAGGIAFWIAGLPGLFWGTVMGFASLIPVVGSWLIWFPATIYLFISGRWGYGIFMLLWCSLVVGMIDNFLRPLFMKGSARMSTLLIFLAILGGINYFGLIGLLYGPLIVGITLVLLYIYSLEFKPFLDHQDRN